MAIHIMSCVMLFPLIFVTVVHSNTGDPSEKVTICTPDNTQCELAKIANFTCVKSDDCVQAVLDGNADLAVAKADEMATHGDNLKVVYGVKRKDVPENFTKYYGLAVVRKGTPFNFKQLKGKNSCHTGIGRTAGWEIPVGYLLFTDEMTFTCNQYQSAANFFGKSCAPGSRSRQNVSKEVKDDLCSLCNGTCGTDSKQERYVSHEGAFMCMAEGNGDRVGFLRHDIANSVFIKYPEKYGNVSDYELLCTDGTKKAWSEFKDCNIDKKPASAFVTKANASASTVKKIQDILMRANLTDLKTGKIISSSVENLMPYEDTAKKYVGSFGDHYNALTDGLPCGPTNPTSTTTSAASSVLVSFTLPTTTSAASSVLVSFTLPITAIFAFLQLA